MGHTGREWKWVGSHREGVGSHRKGWKWVRSHREELGHTGKGGGGWGHTGKRGSHRRGMEMGGVTQGRCGGQRDHTGRGRGHTEGGVHANGNVYLIRTATCEGPNHWPGSFP